MAKVSVRAQNLRDALDSLSEKLEKAKAWAKKKTKPVELEIPEPYDHAARGIPEIRGHCLATRFDECGELAVLIGVLNALGKVPRRK
jgi:hypothetical protein